MEPQNDLHDRTLLTLEMHVLPHREKILHNQKRAQVTLRDVVIPLAEA